MYNRPTFERKAFDMPESEARRSPLTEQQREEILEAYEREERWMLLQVGFHEGFDIEADPGTNPVVLIRETFEEGLSPDDARRLAVLLLQAADYAEFGPGEWDNGEWKPALRPGGSDGRPTRSAR